MTLFLIKTFSKSNIVKIDLIYGEDALIQDIDNVRIDLFQLEIFYENDEVERKIVKKSMISQKDMEKLQKEGFHNITIIYNKFSMNVNLLIYDNDSDLENDIFVLYNLENLELSQNIDDYIPKKDGWYFAGWYVDENCNEEYVENDESNNLLKLYASWSREPVYIVKFMLDENTCLKQEKVIRGGNATPPTISLNSQLIFIGWDKSFENVRENLIVYAKFQKPLVEVYFVDSNNEIISHYVVEKGTKVTPPNAPEIEGYSFVGWSLDTDCVTENMVVKAIYKSIVSVYYYDSDLTTILYILDINGKPENPKKEGLRFDKWVKIETSQPNVECYYATYKELSSTLSLILQDSYVTYDNAVKSTIDIYINKEYVKFIDLKGITHTFRDNNNPLFSNASVSKLTGIYGYYKWFSDFNFTNEIDLQQYIEQIQNSDDLLINDYTLYGQKTEFYPIDNNSWSYTLDVSTDTYRVNYIQKYASNDETYEVFVPYEYKGKKVTIIDTLEVPNDAVVYIGANIEKVILANTSICDAFIVSENNEYYETYCGILLDIKRHSIAKMSNDTNSDILCFDCNIKNDIFNNQDNIKNTLKTYYDAIDSYSFSEFFNYNPSRIYDNTLIFQDNIKIYKSAFSNNFRINLCFAGDFILMDENVGIDYFGFDNVKNAKINYVDLYNFSYDKIIEMTNKIVENTDISFTLYLHNINPSFQPSVYYEEYLILQKIASYYEENYNMTTNLVYDKISIISLQK